MNEASLELLEYKRLLGVVARYAGSEPGRRLLLETHPSTDRETLRVALAEVAEAIRFEEEGAQAPSRAGEPVRLRFSDLPDSSQATAKLRIEGAVLEGAEIAALSTVLERANEARHLLAKQTAAFPLLAQRAARLADFRGLLKELGGKILPDGSVADHASVALARLRRDMERQRAEIQQSLERFLKAHREDGLLQEEFVTIRNDRFVVPVVPGAKRKLPGVVHAASGSGHTLFLEPLETIDLNNDLMRLVEEEQREVHRVLRELTSILRQQAREVRHAAATLAELDALFAKARFAGEFQCTVPALGDEQAPRLRLEDARHPLLEDVLRRQRKRVVPVSLELDASRRTLLISGPNTGGKTVAMKTVGLLALMAQSALPVPAIEAELPVFGDVLADIGDNQSIEQSLSSFSAHLMRVKEMVEAAAPGVLVLLDELGRATDPEEGGALGVAILEEFRRFGAFTLASTHLLALKVYGANTPGVVNASMGFNEATLEPTYVLRIGSPGKSAGLDIASRLGLPPHLLERARLALSDTERDIAQFLKQLELRTTEAAHEAMDLRRRNLELEEQKQKFEKESQRQLLERLRQLERQAEELLAKFDREARRTIEELMAQPEQRRQAERSLRQVARTQREFREAIQELDPCQPAKPAEKAEADLEEGARVRLKDVSEPARVRRILPNGRLEVEVGFLKMQVPREDVLEVLPASASGSRLPKGVSFQQGPAWDTLTREVNVIGKTADEAFDEVDKFLDTAYLAGVMRLRIVHGHGMGVLRKVVHNLLKADPRVEKFYLAPPAEGGNGATIAELKEG
jgi:DNA mismatch repair protein MutS2